MLGCMLIRKSWVLVPSTKNKIKSWQTFAFARSLFFLETERASGLSGRLLGMSWKQSPLKDAPEPLHVSGFFPFSVAFTGPLTHSNFRIQSEFPRTDYSFRSIFFFFLIKICNQHQSSEEKDEKGKPIIQRLSEVWE